MKLLLIDDNPSMMEFTHDTSESPPVGQLTYETQELICPADKVNDSEKQWLVVTLAKDDDMSIINSSIDNNGSSDSLMRMFVLGETGDTVTAITTNFLGESALIGKYIDVSKFFETVNSIMSSIKDLNTEQRDSEKFREAYDNFKQKYNSLKKLMVNNHHNKDD